MVRLREARLIRSNEKGVFGSLPSTSASCRFLSPTREPRPLAKTEKPCFANDSLASSAVQGGRVCVFRSLVLASSAHRWPPCWLREATRSLGRTPILHQLLHLRRAARPSRNQACRS